MALLFADVDVLRLTAHCVPKDKCLWIQPCHADPPLPQRKAAGEADDDTGSDGNGPSSGFDGKPHNLADLCQSDKDNVCLCSSDDSDLEMDPGTSGEESGAPAADTRTAAGAFSDGSDGGDESEPPNTRAAMHTQTPWQNDYFVLTDNKQYPDVEMRVKSRWQGLADLGRSCGSKTLVPGHYGDEGAEPEQVILALKAWMIYRRQQHDWRFLQCGWRLRAWQREVNYCGVRLAIAGASSP